MNQQQSPAIILLRQSIQWFSLTVFIVTPLLYLPFFANPLTLPKYAFILIGTLILLFLYLLLSLHQNKIVFARSPLSSPIVFLTIVSLVSAILSPTPILSHLLGSLGLIIAFAVIYIIITSTPSRLKPFLIALIIPPLISTIFIINNNFELLNLDFLNLSEGGWLTGHPLFFIRQALIGLAAVIALFWSKPKNNSKSIPRILYHVTLAFVILTGLIITIIKIIQTPELAKTLDLSSSWRITIDSIKSKPLFGVGPDQFETAFTQFKPYSLNQFDNFTTRYRTSGSEIFNLVTELGFFGLAILILLFTRLWKLIVRERRGTPLYILPAIVSLIFLFLIPAGILGWIELLICLIIITIPHKFPLITLGSKFQPYELSHQDLIKTRRGASGVTTAPLSSIIILSVLIIAGIFYVCTFLSADYYFQRSLIFGQRGQGGETFQLQQKAILQNPHYLDYYLAFSNTNIQLANALLQNKDSNQETTSQLINFALEYAREAQTKWPRYARISQQLAEIYKSLIGASEEAPQLALAQYSQAINLDPANPDLYFARGQLFTQLESYDQAVDSFKIATNLKPNWVLAWYQLGLAQINNQRDDLAQQAFIQALNLSTSEEEEQTIDEAIQALDITPTPTVTIQPTQPTTPNELE